jgi:Neuraminidase (sialidase)
MMKVQVVLTLITIFVLGSCSHKRNTTGTKDHGIDTQGDLQGTVLDKVRKELAAVVFESDTVPGIGHETGCTRRDPSDVIKVDDTWYVWYTKVYGRSPGYWGTIWYATSKDEGYTWEEKGEALGIGAEGSFDSQAVFTPNILYARGKYYLFYTGVKPTPGRTDGVFENNSTNDFTAIGVAGANSPDGPFSRFHG